MAHFYGIIQGNRGEATRMGTKASSFHSTTASWEGAVDVFLHYDEEKGKDMVSIRLKPWHGSGTHRELFEGPISGSY